MKKYESSRAKKSDRKIILKDLNLIKNLELY